MRHSNLNGYGGYTGVVRRGRGWIKKSACPNFRQHRPSPLLDISLSTCSCMYVLRRGIILASMSFEIEVVKKVPLKVKVSISNEQEKFCQLYARDPKLAGKPYECYMKVYKDQLEPHQTPEVVRKEAKALLTQDNIIQRINGLLEEDGFNDSNVDKQHLFLINQHGDLSVKMKGIEHYNKLKRRTNDQPIFVLPRPIMDLSDDEQNDDIHKISKEDVKVIDNNG